MNWGCDLKMELISVIVPIYNVEKYLMRCVGSIQKQSYKNLEIILVDDGSPDACPQICDELMTTDSRIKVIHKENAGQGLARNDGLDIATGEYVTFIDSDDWIEQTHIENLYRAIVKEQADIAIGNHIWVSVAGEQSVKMLSLKEQLYEADSIVNDIMLPLIGADITNHSDVQVNSSVSMSLYRMDLIKKHGIRFISERYAVAEDFFFNLDFLYHSKKAIFVKESGYFYCQNLESTCEKYNPKRFERTLNYYTTICEKVEQYGLKNRVAYRIERSFLMKLRVAIRHIVMSNLNLKDKLQRMREILENDIVNKVLNTYPIETYVPAMRLLAKKMRSKSILSVYCLMKFREMGRRKNVLKTFFRWIGIGK